MHPRRPKRYYSAEEFLGFANAAVSYLEKAEKSWCLVILVTFSDYFEKILVLQSGFKVIAALYRVAYKEPENFASMYM